MSWGLLVSFVGDRLFFLAICCFKDVLLLMRRHKLTFGIYDGSQKILLPNVIDHVLVLNRKSNRDKTSN